MKYAYKQFHSDMEIEAFFDEINNNIYLSVDKWYQEDGLRLYGCFYDEENITNYGHYLFCFGQTIYPDVLQPLSNDTVFAKLKHYASSSRYKGLKDVRGQVVLGNRYDEITHFYTTDTYAYFVVERGNKKGIYRLDNGKMSIIAPVQYDDFFDAGEYTWGYLLDGSVGFMSLEGRLVTQAKYRQSHDFNHFVDGKALVCVNNPNGVDHYVNHYGDCIGYPQDDFPNKEHTLGTGYYPYGDLPDTSDAYEGDDSNRWNTD